MIKLSLSEIHVLYIYFFTIKIDFSSSIIDLKMEDGSSHLKVARYSFSGPIPPKFEHKLRRHKQSFGKIATTVVLDKDENLL